MALTWKEAALRAWALPVVMAMGVLASGLAPVWAQDGADGDRPFTRRDLLTALYPLVKRMEAQGAIAPSRTPSIMTYADLEGRDRDWAVELASQFHLFAGMPALTTGRFNPTLPLTRWEASVVLGELLYQAHPEARKLLPPGESRVFSDLTPTEVRRLEPVVTPGVLIGFPDQTFRTQEPLTHAQWARVTERLGPLAAFQAPAPDPRKPPALQEEFRLLERDR
jgi:hypothetical protein